MPTTISGSAGITLPSGSAGVGTTDTQTLTNKTLTTPNIDSAQFATVSGTAPLYAARAWVNFNGTGTVAIRGSGNVSSITDNGTGDYTVNFTTAITDVNYAVSGSARFTTATNSMYLAIGASGGSGTYSTSALQVRSVSFSSGTSFDCDIVNVAIFR